jgi:hypothetical protein
MHEALENNFDCIVPENPFNESNEPKSVEKWYSKICLDNIQFLVEITSGIDLNASLFENTWFLLSAPSSKALKKSTFER